MTTLILGCPGCSRTDCPVCTIPKARQRHRAIVVDPNLCGRCQDGPIGGVGMNRDICWPCESADAAERSANAAERAARHSVKGAAA
jgi:hypothetical protein